ncbi:MAG: hypothetical protein ACK5ZR_16900 [Gemmatimonadaceae bacterium]
MTLMQSPAFSSDDVRALHDQEYRIPNTVSAHIRDLMHQALPPRHGEVLEASQAIVLAVQDLQTYHFLLADAIRSLRFTEQEAALIVDVCRGWSACDPWTASGLWQALHEHLASEEIDAPDGSPTGGWRRELVEYLRLLSPFEALAVVRTVQRLESISPDETVSTALAAVGLIAPECDDGEELGVFGRWLL